MRWTLPLAALLVAAVAQAGDHPAPKPGRHAIDPNNDGIVSRDEMHDYRVKQKRGEGGSEQL